MSTFTIKTIFKSIAIYLLVGLLSGLSSAFFLKSLEFVTDYREQNLYLIYFLPIIGLVIGYWYYKFGSDVEDGNKLISQVFKNQNELVPLKMAPMILISTLLSHLFGASVGREGTALQISGSISDQFSKLFKVTAFEKNLILYAAISGGFSSVFGTPFAGAIFALEFFNIRKFNYLAIFPIVIAGFFADYVCKSLGLHHVYYQVNKFPILSIDTLFLVAIAGVFFGFGALFYCTLQTYFKGLASKLFKTPYFRPFFAGLITIIFYQCLGNSRFLGLGIPVILESFSNQLPFYEFAIKLVLTAFTLAFGFKGGEVTPLFFIGACLGNALSLVLPLPFGFLAGLGFVCLFGAAAKTPITSIILGIELFGFEMGIFLFISSFFAYVVSGKNGIYSNN